MARTSELTIFVENYFVGGIQEFLITGTKTDACRRAYGPADPHFPNYDRYWIVNDKALRDHMGSHGLRRRNNHIYNGQNKDPVARFVK